jgi:hypothetical protein
MFFDPISLWVPGSAKPRFSRGEDGIWNLNPIFEIDCMFSKGFGQIGDKNKRGSDPKYLFSVR